MKRFFIYVLMTLTCALLFAGDAAVFMDLGFSKDGSVYMFGQYGKKDKSYEAWAEIFTVDVVSNNYVKNEVYSTSSGKSMTSLSGKSAYEKLVSDKKSKFSKYQCVPYTPEQLLYIRTSEDKKGTDEIVFRNFSENVEDGEVTSFHVRLVPTYNGKGKNISSKYYIDVSLQDEDGNIKFSKQIGTPDLQRKGISNYRIDRIVTDSSGTSLVFIVEKTLIDDTGTSIRYMVETMKM